MQLKEKLHIERRGLPGTREQRQKKKKEKEGKDQ